MPNEFDINSISPIIRDSLLSKNLRLSSIIENSPYATYGASLGQPYQLPAVTGVVQQPTIDNDSPYRRELQIVLNSYQPIENEEVNIVINPNSLPTISDEGGYGFLNTSDNESSFRGELAIENYQDNVRSNIYRSDEVERVSINTNPTARGGVSGDYFDSLPQTIGNSISIQPINIIGSALSGSLIGNADGTLSPNVDIRTNILGRGLTAIGAIDDTPLGKASAQMLGNQMLNSLAINTQRAISSRINPIGDIFSRDEDGKVTIDLFKDDDTITKSNTTVDFATDVLGIELPISKLKDNALTGKVPNLNDLTGESSLVNITPLGSNFTNYYNDLLGDTGNGVKDKLKYNVLKNRYNASYDGYVSDEFKGYIYTTDDDIITFEEVIKDSTKYGGPLLSKRTKSVETIKNDFDTLYQASGFANGYGFTWDYANDDEVLDSENLVSGSNPNSLVMKTKILFDDGAIQTLDGRRSRIDIGSEIQSGGKKNGTTLIVSKGSAVTNPDSGEFCRVWTKKDGYDSILDLQKNSSFKLREYNNGKSALSVLQDNGFIKIAPAKDEGDIKKFMFSIENLAWADNLTDLPKCEVGNGDLNSGTKGRIMWFPPYGLDFSENSSSNWDSHEFIGRGEPMYTYKNSERTGNLSFKMVIDHPNVINGLSNLTITDEVRENLVALFAGCIDDLPNSFKQYFNDNELSEFFASKAKKPVTKVSNAVKPLTYSVYFLNDVEDYYDDYEVTNTQTYASYVPSDLNSSGDGSKSTSHNETDSSLNKNFNDALINGDIQSFFDGNDNVLIEVKGYASTPGTGGRNQTLSERRADNIKNVLPQSKDVTFKTVIGNGVDTSTSTTEKEARRVDITIKVDPTLDESKLAPEKASKDEIDEVMVDRLIRRSYSECDYFDTLSKENDDKFAHGAKEIYSKIKYFHPTFHSTTPEGFNARLNFLLQCTRMGPTVRDGSADNLSFGKPPVCILRIGDFYNTKIIIDNVDYSFDPLVWDLNPEGVGVQPMLVNVNMSFKFIGGSSLSGPINKLQNAVSNNFFANTEMYDSKAESAMVTTKITDNTIPTPITKPLVEEMKIDELDRLESELENSDDEELLSDEIFVSTATSTTTDLSVNFTYTFNETKKIRFSLKSTINPTTIDLGSLEFDSIGTTKTLEFKYSSELSSGIYLLRSADGTVSKKITIL